MTSQSSAPPGSFFDRVVGGELPLDPILASLWDDEGTGVDEAALVRRHAGCQTAGLWLKSGRAALGVVLDLVGEASDRGVAIPAYQCWAVVEKIARRARWHAYPLLADFRPDLESLRDLAPGVVLTTAYFGSQSHMDRLEEMGHDLWALPGRPWIVEDRVQCLLEDGPPRLGRDFVIYSLRKHYPIPDGALLIAVSDRAKEVMLRWRRPQAQPATLIAAASMVKAKLAAKMARWQWINTPPIADDPARNGLAACVQSEQALDGVAFDRHADGLPASAGSARLLLGRDPAQDLATARALIGQLVAQCRDRLPQAELPIADAGALGLPILHRDRDALRRKAAAAGIFLPVHWPRDPRIADAGIAERWYVEELTLPINPSHTQADVLALASVLSDSWETQ